MPGRTVPIFSIFSFDQGTFFGDIQAGRFQVYGLIWVAIRTPDIFRYAFGSGAIPPDGANRGRYRSPAADARAEPGLVDQVVLCRALATRLHEDLPNIPLWYEDQMLATRDGVSGYRLAPDGNYDGLEGVDWDPRTGPPPAGAAG